MADPVEPEFAGGDGTEGNPYLIATAAQLNNVRNHLDKHFKQIANINLNVVLYNQDEGWNPIGTSDEAFTGTYDGNDKTITGLRIVRSSSSRVGLFGAAKGATLKNLTLEDVAILAQSSVGGLVGVVTELGTLTAPTKIEDVHLISGSVSGTSFVGGLVGTLGGSNIQDSSAGCDVTGVVQGIGGLVGQVDGPATIWRCHATGNATASGTGLCQSVGGLAGILSDRSTITWSYASGNVMGKTEVGGLVGLNAGGISGCYAVGAVKGHDSIGGLVGRNYGGQISRCFASGAAEGFASDDGKGQGYGIGGLVGRNVLGGTVGNCYAMGAVQGVSQVGGLVGSNPSGSITCAYATGPVTGTTAYGGLIGEGGGCTKSYWDTDTSGCTKSAGGPGAVGKTTTEMKQQATYDDWDFAEIWAIHASQNSGYPFLITVTPVDPVTPSTQAEIAAFNFSPSDGTVIDCTATTGTVEVLVDSSTDLTDLKATFTLSAGAVADVGGVRQESGVTSQNFTAAKTYVVTAEDGTTTKNWTVKVTKREPKPDTEEPLWYYRSPWPTAKSLREVKYLNGKFMAVGERGALGVSVNGIDWTSSDLKVSHTLEAIAYGNGKYIAIGNQRTGLDGTIYGSADGVNWTHLATVPDHYLSDIICVDGKFVAVGQSGRILTSADGATWKVTAAAEVKNQLNAVAYADGTYVAVGKSGVVVTSPDGENWAERPSLGSDTLRDVAYGNGRFVIVGGYDTACIYSSADRGETWTKYAFGITCYGLLNSVDYDGSRFVTVGYRPDILAPSMFTSTDGTTWQRQSGIPQDMSLAAVAGGGGKWVAVSFKYDILTSTNGTTWAELGQGTRQHLLKVAYGGSTFVAVGYNGAIQTSPDGITWTLRPSGTSENLQSVRYMNHGFVVVGEKGTILTSGDGTAWTKQTSGVSVVLNDVTYGNGKYVAVGGVDYTAVILVSSDGVTWTPVDHEYLIPFMTVAFGNGTFISLGKNGQVYRSTDDGETWARTYLPGNGYPRDVVYADGRFVATGGNGRIWVSDDSGASWTLYAEAGGVSQYINSVDYGGGRLVAVASYGLIVVSADKGATWTQQPSGLADPDMHLYGVAAGDASFVAVGAWGLVLQSKDFGLPDDPDASAVAAAKAALTWDVIGGENTRQDSVTSNLVNPLPTSGASGTTIGWSAEPTGFINTTTGAIARPTFAQGNRTVALTASIRKGDASDTVTFALTILAADATPDEAIDTDLTWLTWNLIKGSNSTESQVTSGLNLVDSGPHDTTISWSAEPAGVINTTTGLVTRPAAGQGNAQVRLTAVVSKEGGQDGTKEFELTIIALPSTGSGGGVAPVYYTISAAAGPGGTISPKSASVASYGSQTFTITPDEGYEIEDVLVDGKSVGVVASYTFERINKKHTISAIFKKIEEPVAESPFKDVEETDWFYNSVKYVFENGLMTGTSTDIFNPLLDTNRAMIVTILHRLEKTPDAPANMFTDVDAGTWYTGAVAWAAANGIVKGYGGGLFGPTDSVTREQLACILYNYARYAGYDVSQSAELTGFVDGGSTSAWAVEAMQWAVGSGLIRGKGNGLLDPTGPATRAEVAAILERFIEGNTK
ncbi:MAG: immunoglobulin-like domain-containing protein [Bacillota bacterium]